MVPFGLAARATRAVSSGTSAPGRGRTDIKPTPSGDTTKSLIRRLTHDDDQPPAVLKIPDRVPQWWDYLYSRQDGTLIVNPLGDNGRRLGLNKWNLPGTGVAYSPTIGITLNYYNTPSLVFLVDGKLPI